MSETRIVRDFEMPDGKKVTASVNRRGCKGEWTEKDDEALAAIVRAIHENPPFPSSGVTE